MKFYHWGSNILPDKKPQFLFDAYWLFFPYEPGQNNQHDFHLACNWISLFMSWLPDGTLGIICPWLVAFPPTVCRTLGPCSEVWLPQGVLIHSAGIPKEYRSYWITYISQILFFPTFWKMLIDHLWGEKVVKYAHWPFKSSEKSWVEKPA